MCAMFISKALWLERVNEGSHSFSYHPHVYPQLEPGIERIQALADISRSGYVVISNETRAPIVNLPSSVQLERTPYHCPKLYPGPCSIVGMR